MGTNKALLSIGGRTFAESSFALLAPICDEVCIVGGTDPNLKILNISHVPDDVPDRGPLGGIATGFGNLSFNSIIVIPCDLPLLTPAVIELLAHDITTPCDIAVINTDDGIQPLVGRYFRSVEERLLTFLDEGGRSVKEFLARCSVTVLNTETKDPGMDRVWWKNVNTQSDFEDVQNAMRAIG